jgi:aerobic carbon-monoxide dehydrogenase medium subunit
VLTGAPLDETRIAEAARIAAAAAQPRPDHRGSAAYKRHLVATFVRRLLERASVPTEEVAA